MKKPKSTLEIRVESDGTMWAVREVGNYPSVLRNTNFENTQFFDNRWEAMEHAEGQKEKYAKRGDDVKLFES